MSAYTDVIAKSAKTASDTDPFFRPYVSDGALLSVTSLLSWVGADMTIESGGVLTQMLSLRRKVWRLSWPSYSTVEKVVPSQSNVDETAPNTNDQDETRCDAFTRRENTGVCTGWYEKEGNRAMLHVC